MTLREVLELLQSEPEENRDLELKIWLPGSRISLGHGPGSTLIRSGGVLMIEGNVDEGSALQ